MEIKYTNAEMLGIINSYLNDVDPEAVETVNIKSNYIRGKRVVSFTISGNAKDNKEDINLSTGDILKVTL